VETYNRLFAGRDRRLITGYDNELSIGKYHYYKTIDWDLAADDEYWIELVFNDYFILSTLDTRWDQLHIQWDQCHLLWNERITAPQTETFTLKYCTLAGRSLTTKDINEIGRKWNVGEIA
jgi:hypothetical protein